MRHEIDRLREENRVLRAENEDLKSRLYRLRQEADSKICPLCGTVCV
jgi:regulator of replication initiation timing